MDLNEDDDITGDEDFATTATGSSSGGGATGGDTGGNVPGITFVGADAGSDDGFGDVLNTNLSLPAILSYTQPRNIVI